MKKNTTSFQANGRLEEKAKIIQDILGENNKNKYLSLSSKDFEESVRSADEAELKVMCDEFNISKSGIKESVKERLLAEYSREKKVKFSGQFSKDEYYSGGVNSKKFKDAQNAIKNL